MCPTRVSNSMWRDGRQVPPRDTKFQSRYVCQRVNYTCVLDVSCDPFPYFAEAAFSKSFLRIRTNPGIIKVSFRIELQFLLARKSNQLKKKSITSIMYYIKNTQVKTFLKKITADEKKPRVNHSLRNRSFTLYRPSLIPFYDKIIGKNISFFFLFQKQIHGQLISFF